MVNCRHIKNKQEYVHTVAFKQSSSERSFRVHARSPHVRMGTLTIAHSG